MEARSGFRSTCRMWLGVTLLAGLLVVVPGPADALPDGLEAEVVASGLGFPVSVASTPDGRLLVTEKFGDVRLVADGELRDEPVASFNSTGKNEAGLLGLELTPGFEQTGEFLVSYTPADDLQHLYVSRVRLNEDGSGEVLADPWLELPSRPKTDRHYGGNIRFGPQGHLFVELSDLDNWRLSQDTSRLPGSLLRYNPDGSVPTSNPLGPDNPIYSYGLRNTFDFDITDDGRIYGAENGLYLHDAIERLEAGSNHGWPAVHGFCDNYPMIESCQGLDGYVDPVFEFRNRIGPSGLVVYDGDLIDELEGDILMGGFHTGSVHRLTPGADGQLTERPLFFVLPAGPGQAGTGDKPQNVKSRGVTDVEVASDGAVLVVQGHLEVGTIYRIAPTEEIRNPDRVVEEGRPRLNFGDRSVCATGVGGGPVGFLGWVIAVLLVVWRRRPGFKPGAGPDTAGTGRVYTPLRGAKAAAGTEASSMRAGGGFSPPGSHPPSCPRIDPGSGGFSPPGSHPPSCPRIDPGLATGLLAIFLAVVTFVAPSRARALDFEAGPTAGLGTSQIIGRNTNAASMRATPSIGGALNIQVTPWFSGRLDGFYILRGASNDLLQEQLELHYLMFPMTAQFALPLENVQPRFFVGPYLGVLLKAEFDDVGFNDRINNFDAGLTAGFGVTTELGFADFVVDAAYHQGLAEVFDGDAAPAYHRPPRVLNISIMLSAGLLF